MAEIKSFVMRLPDDLEAKYVNIVYILHTPREFVLDFATMLPGVKDPKVNTRLVLSPLSMKLMQQAINENVRRYEAQFGEIAIPQGHSLADQLFKPPESQQGEDKDGPA